MPSLSKCLVLFYVALLSTTVICIKEKNLQKLSADEQCSEGAGQNCIKCSADLTKCEICYQGYYLDTNTNKCKACTEGCNTCTGPTFADCIYCKAKYYKSEYSCEPCVGNCNVCRGPEPKDCLTCSVQTFNNTDLKQCLNCVEGCTECHGSTYDECDVDLLDGYYYNEDTMTVRKCEDTMPKCKKCSDPYACELCEEGYYYLNETTRKCDTCSEIEGCLKCLYKDSGKMCIQPRRFYCLVEESVGFFKAEKCPGTKCEKCDSEGICTGKCTKCMEGYFINDDGICEECAHRDCVKCDKTGKCTECKDTHTLLDDGTCLYCDSIPHCKQCTKYPLVCGLCEDHYVIDDSNGNCVYKKTKEEEEEEERKRKEEEEKKSGTMIKLGLIMGLLIGLLF